MAPAVKTRSPLRTEQAAQTRRRILEAAGEVLVEQGFSGTRVEDVADRAGVAVPTVYKVFTNKRNLLTSALNVAMAGDDGERIDAQSWWIEQLSEPDPVEQLRLVARNARRIYERAAALIAVLDAAAPADDELLSVRDDIAAQRLKRSQRTAKSLQQKLGDRLRGSRAEAAITLLSLSDPALFRSFTSTGRSARQYETWLADVLTRALVV